MDTQLWLWLALGALAVVVLVVALVALVSFRVMRRLSRAVEQNWTALTAALDERSDAAAPLIAAAAVADRTAATGALAALAQAQQPNQKAAAERDVQRALRPIAAAAATRTVTTQPDATELTEARASLTAAWDAVQQRRRDYNTVVRELNAKVRRFPTSVWAGAVGGRRDFFDVDQTGVEAEQPRIRF